MSFTPILALGLISQSIFFGGNIAISSLFIPIIRNTHVLPSSQIKLWAKLYSNGAKLMVTSALTSFVCYLYQAYYTNDEAACRSMLITAGFSISTIPFTATLMFPTIKKLKGLVPLSDEALVSNDFGSLIDYWNKLSIIRLSLFSLGFVNALWYQIATS